MTRENPLVSIIIPTYNRAHLIGETLDSVLAQTYANWECIVVDDGSTDNTDEVMEKYMAKDARFQYHHRPNDRLHGGNAARNYGFELSKGEYINFLDSDDLFHREAIKTKIELIKFYESDVVISTHTSEERYLSSNADSSPLIFRDFRFDIEFILARNTIMTSDPMIQRKYIKNVKWDETLIRYQEHVFFIHLFRQKMDICFIDLKLYYHRPARTDNLSNSVQYSRSRINLRAAIQKEMNLYYAKEEEVLIEYKRRARKLYKKIMIEGNPVRVIEHYQFFKDAFSLSFFEFTFYFLCNLLFKKCFDRMDKNST